MLKSLGSCMNIDKRLYLKGMVGMKLEFGKVFYYSIFWPVVKILLSFVAQNYVLSLPLPRDNFIWLAFRLIVLRRSMSTTDIHAYWIN